MKGSISRIIEGLDRVDEALKNKNYTFSTNTSISKDKSLKEDYGKFISKVEGFVKSITKASGNENIKVLFEFDQLVGRGYTGTLTIYGFNEMYSDDIEFDRFASQTEKQMNGLVKSMIGDYESEYMTKYWTAKRKVGSKNIEIGPYIEYEFSEKVMYGGVDESVSEAVQNSTKKTKIHDWYIKFYPDDDLGESIKPNTTFEDVYKDLSNGAGGKVYNIIGVGDSVVRERIFTEIARIYKVKYDDIYNMYIGENTNDEDLDSVMGSMQKIVLNWKRGMITYQEAVKLMKGEIKKL